MAAWVAVTVRQGREVWEWYECPGCVTLWGPSGRLERCRPGRTVVSMATPAACCPVFVERDRELAVLARVADQAARGVSQLVVLGGEAGAGKSRLAAEFIGSLPAGWRTTTRADLGSPG